MRSLAVFLVSLILPVALATDYGTCTGSNGIKGSCIATSSCSGGGGSHEAGLCPGPADIQCCTYGSCTASGTAGKCQPTSTCSGTKTAGLCPGPADVQCCTTASSGGGSTDHGTCTGSNGLGGSCISTSSCSSGGGSHEAGLCPGPADIQCCTYGTCSGGSCSPTSMCTGTSTPGLCPGPANIQCCSSSSGGGGGSGSTGALPGLNSVQSGHAHTIADAAHTAGLPERACIVAIATAMVESSIRVLANTGIPESYNYPHDGEGSDHDSVGIFQQRTPSWGTVQSCMDPASSAGKFYAKLKTISGWESMSIGNAAQAVQVSAYPDRYENYATLGTNVCAAAY